MRRSESEAREWVEEKKINYDAVRNRIDSAIESEEPPGTIVPKFHSVYINAFAAATYSLVLGDVETARKWFHRAADTIRDQRTFVVDHYDDVGWSRQKMVSNYGVKSLTCACLADDWACAEEIATSTRTESETVANLDHVRTVERLESQVLATTVLDDGDVNELADQLIETAEEMDEYFTAVRPGQSGLLAGTATAIVDRDQDATVEGITAIVAAHEDHLDGEPSRAAQVVSHLAVALLVLANHRGLDVHVDSEYVPDAVYDLRSD